LDQEARAGLPNTTTKQITRGTDLKVKTTLVSGVPWPAQSTPVKSKKQREKEEQTDINFEVWVKKQKQHIDIGKMLGAKK
jgi:hypothetical protein